jgi:hypothetical protein
MGIGRVILKETRYTEEAEGRRGLQSMGRTGVMGCTELNTFQARHMQRHRLVKGSDGSLGE